MKPKTDDLMAKLRKSLETSTPSVLHKKSTEGEAEIPPYKTVTVSPVTTAAPVIPKDTQEEGGGGRTSKAAKRIYGQGLRKPRSISLNDADMEHSTKLQAYLLNHNIRANTTEVLTIGLWSQEPNPAFLERARKHLLQRVDHRRKNSK